MPYQECAPSLQNSFKVGDTIQIVRNSLFSKDGKERRVGIIVRMPIVPPHTRLSDALALVQVGNDRRAWPVELSEIFPIDSNT